MENEKLITLINKFGKSVVDNQKKNLKDINTGNLLRSINYRYKVEAENVIIDFISLDYGQYVDEGRKKGSFPPLSAIKAWVKRKGLPEKSAFPIANKIYKFGIPPRPFLLKGYKESQQNFINELIKLEETTIVKNVKQGFGVV